MTIKKFDPFSWFRSTQNWFTKTEKSSGFRPYLIFLFMLFGFILVLLVAFPESDVTAKFAVPSLFIAVGGFVLLYFLKALQDPTFCRSEKHVETVKRIEMMERKGDAGPIPIDVKTTPIPDPQPSQLPKGTDGGKQ